MNKTFRAGDRNQLLPPSLLDWLPERHLARFIVDVVEQLDPLELYGSFQEDGRGQPSYDFRMLTTLLLYAYGTGVVSSRQIENRTHEDVAFRVIAANRQPDHDSICAFRKRHLKGLAGLFAHVLRLWQEAELVKLEHVSHYGAKVRANASKQEAMSYGRMKKKRLELEQEIRGLLKHAEAVDRRADGIYGKYKKGWDLPEEPQRKETRLMKIKEAMSALEPEADQEALDKRQAKELKSKSCQGSATPPSGSAPSDKSQRNFTDPDSRIMKVSSTHSFEQCCNGQALVDDAFQVIVAAGLSQRANDMQEVEPILDVMEQNLGRIPRGTPITTDAGYLSDAKLMLFEDAMIDPLYGHPQDQARGSGATGSRAPPTGYDARGSHAKNACCQARPTDLLQKEVNG